MTDVLPGEIDLLIADPGKGRLWACEVKDPEAAHSLPAISRHIGNSPNETDTPRNY
jgi:hypothetical protein